jgi:UDP-4-amino-4-deoxy-L-arabinose-oxoglutarate aminotransferase
MTLRSGLIANGVAVREFEARIAQYLGSRLGFARATGTAALELALRAIGVNSGDGVILPTYVCRSALDAVVAVGAAPQLCDVDEYGLLTLDTAARACTPRTRAIIAVHLFGQACDIAALKSLNLPIIEDACQAFGLRINGRMAGTIGEVGVLSFHATKCLTTGEGGMVLTGCAEMERRLGALRDAPAGPNYLRGAVLSDLQAALGLSQLERYPQMEERRSAMYARYRRAVETTRFERRMAPDTVSPFRFIVRNPLSFRDAEQHFLSRGIVVRRGVDTLLHHLQNLGDRGFPVARKLFEENLSLPFHPSLQEEEINRVLCAIGEA